MGLVNYALVQSITVVATENVAGLLTKPALPDAALPPSTMQRRKRELADAGWPGTCAVCLPCRQRPGAGVGVGAVGCGAAAGLACVARGGYVDPRAVDHLGGRGAAARAPLSFIMRLPSRVGGAMAVETPRHLRHCRPCRVAVSTLALLCVSPHPPWYPSPPHPALALSPTPGAHRDAPSLCS